MSTTATTRPRSAAPVSARRAQTRERLLAAATTVFAERGVNGASVEEICETAGFTRGAFYSNFADKDALVLALIQADVAAQYAAAQQALEEVECALGRQPVADVVSQTLARFDRFGATTREGVLAQRELQLHAARVPALHGPYTAFLETSSAQLRTLLEGALERVGLEFVLPVELAVELLLHAARVPALHRPYRDFLAASSEQLRTLLTGALERLGLEFTLPVELAVEMLLATHARVQTQALFDEGVGTTALQALVLAITRPRADAPCGTGDATRSA